MAGRESGPTDDPNPRQFPHSSVGRGAVPGPPDDWPPYAKGDNLPGAGMFGVVLYIISLLVPFICAVVAYVVTREAASSEMGWPPRNAPSMPGILWVNTVLVLITSGLVEWERRAARQEEQPSLRLATSLTLVSGVAFLVCQVLAFAAFASAFSVHVVEGENLPKNLNMLVATFYLLVGLHGIHVLGGVIVQGVVTYRAHRGHYRFYHHPGLRYSAVYWHFVGAMWLLVFFTLVIGNDW